MTLPARSVLAGLFAIVAMTFIPGCGAAATDAEAADTSDDEGALTAAQSKALTEKVKAAYEASVTGQKSYWLPGEQVVSGDELRGSAKAAFKHNASVSKGYGYGYPEVRKATVDGAIVYAISGIVSDTGDILGFYPARGKELCEAYSGQGENPNANGVDWWH
ncbi:MAG: hypothetical protein U0235_12795 [Polyangiaceae bacterium]